VTVSATSDVYFDPYSVEINADPYPCSSDSAGRCRCYYNAQHDFYAVSRYEDVNRGIVDHQTYSSRQGCDPRVGSGADFPIPSGVLIFEDPPIHDIPSQAAGPDVHPAQDRPARGEDPQLLRRLPRPDRRAGRFDFVTDLGAVMPMKTISAADRHTHGDQEKIRDHVTSQMKTEAGQPMKAAEEGLVSGDIFADYIGLAGRQSVRRHHDELLNVRIRRRDRDHPPADP